MTPPVVSSALVLALAITNCARRDPARPPQQEQMTRAVSAPARLEPPAYLPPVAREILRRRMVSHARDMIDLMTAIMVLRYDDIGAHAQAIAGDVDMARPLTGDATELNTLLPPRFFDLQDELRGHARSLSAAAAAQNATDVASVYGKVAQTCVSCHATYRAGNGPAR